MLRSVLRTTGFQLFSLLVAGFTLLSIFAVSLGQLGGRYAALAVATLATAVALRYVAVYHRFSRLLYRAIALVPPTIAFLGAGTLAVRSARAGTSIDALERAVRTDSFQFGSSQFLPEWWAGLLLALAGGLMILGAVVQRDLEPYPRPGELRTVAASPAYFGVACAIFGLWAVLLVGISIQRVIVIAPIFEELLKFGVALLVGSVLFGRSMAARIGVALVVGALFGLVEHATTYPAEADAVYLFRTLFHASTTILSVGLYTLFDARGHDRLRWIAPIYSICLHFFYNTFVVLSAVIGVVAFGSASTTVSLLYGGVAILVAGGLLVLAVLSPRAIVGIHRPFEALLSDLV